MAILEWFNDRLILVRERKHLQVWHRVIGFYVFLLFAWGFYRFLSPLPVWVEEVFLKGLVFGVPVFWLVLKKEKGSLASLGIGAKNLFESVYLGLALGVFFWFFGQLANFLRYRGVLSIHEIQPTSPEFGAFLLLALVTAWWEELVFMGYILQRIAKVVSNEWRAALITSGMFCLMYVPAVLLRGGGVAQLVLQMILMFMVGLGNSILMLRTRNLAAPILAHALWGAAVYLLV